MMIFDFNKKGEEFVVAIGGKGGLGNTRFKSSTNRAPRKFTKGGIGEEFTIWLQLKTIADVGIIGLPNAGKSSLLAAITNANPKIANYRFTTLNPNLGVASYDDKEITIADIPGLVEGAHEGVGLGIQFLKHIERTRLILHVLDMGSFEGRDPIEDFEVINAELGGYSHNLLAREQIVVANKMDLPDAKENLKRFKEKYPKIDVVEVSGVTKEGIETLLLKAADKLDEIGNVFFVAKQVVKKTYKFNEDKEIRVYRDEEGIFNVEGRELEKLVKMTNFNTEDNMRRFAQKVKGLGVYELLEEQGIEPGEAVRLYGYEFQYDQ